jgi:hypothetical protein
MGMETATAMGTAATNTIPILLPGREISSFNAVCTGAARVYI